MARASKSNKTNTNKTSKHSDRQREVDTANTNAKLCCSPLQRTFRLTTTVKHIHVFYRYPNKVRVAINGGQAETLVRAASLERATCRPQLKAYWLSHTLGSIALPMRYLARTILNLWDTIACCHLLLLVESALSTIVLLLARCQWALCRCPASPGPGLLAPFNRHAYLIVKLFARCQLRITQVNFKLERLYGLYSHKQCYKAISHWPVGVVIQRVVEPLHRGVNTFMCTQIHLGIKYIYIYM